MALVSKPSLREGFTPFVFFKGTLEEARRVSAQDVLRAFQTGIKGVVLRKKLLSHSNWLKKRLLEHMEVLENTGSAGHRFVLSETPVGEIVFSIRRFENGRFLVHQAPAVHGITLGRNKVGNVFLDLKKILAQGFRGKRRPNVIFGRKRRTGDARQNYPAAEPEQHGFPGDSFSLELMAPVKNVDWWRPRNYAASNLRVFMKRALPNQILAVDIVLNPDISEEETKQRKAFYKRELKGVPLRFVE